MRRRSFLAGTALSIGLFAGCTSSSENSDTGESTDGTPEPAQFRVESVEAPKKAELATNFTVSVTVRNSGGKEGQFKTQFVKKVDWESERRNINTTVPPHSSETIDVTVSHQVAEELKFSLTALDGGASTQIIPRHLKYGKSFVTPEGIELSIQEIRHVDEYTVYDDFYGSERTETATSGKQFAFAHVKATNTSDKPATPRDTMYMSALYDGRVFDEKTMTGAELRGQFNGAAVFDSPEIDPGFTQSGWIAFPVPDTASRSEVSIQWKLGSYSNESPVIWES